MVSAPAILPTIQNSIDQDYSDSRTCQCLDEHIGSQPKGGLEPFSSSRPSPVNRAGWCSSQQKNFLVVHVNASRCGAIVQRTPAFTPSSIPPGSLAAASLPWSSATSLRARRRRYSRRLARLDLHGLRRVGKRRYSGRRTHRGRARSSQAAGAIVKRTLFSRSFLRCATRRR